ncbi:MAG: hypothetical protein COU25_03685 [Candidatus Levybacteria bacterium CG10_big_fil_rev_8_21_14_0_10_35_13]|nr:MAG: hypothetical protein COU25_03685 [Candidatus Levybacteria bacterium CG10_big_fil_rev_8_21_14_0_10_35_13]
MTQAYYFSDFMTDITNDYVFTFSEIKQEIKDYMDKSKRNFYKTIKSASDKLSNYLENLIEMPVTSSEVSETKITIDDVINNMFGTYSAQTNPNIVPILQNPSNSTVQNSAGTTVVPQNYVLPKQYTNAIKVIGVNESENDLTDILLGAKKDLKTWNKRINELGVLLKKYSAQVIDKYKLALGKNSYLRYKKKAEYVAVLTSLEALKT